MGLIKDFEPQYLLNLSRIVQLEPRGRLPLSRIASGAIPMIPPKSMMRFPVSTPRMPCRRSSKDICAVSGSLESIPNKDLVRGKTILGIVLILKKCICKSREAGKSLIRVRQVPYLTTGTPPTPPIYVRETQIQGAIS